MRSWLSYAALAAALFLLVGCGGDSEEEREPREPFQPKASLTAVGGTARTDKPELVLHVEPRPGDPGIRAATVTLPAAFIVDQTALANLCSERELKANDCAGRNRIGFARVASPAYEGTLSGPVYAVSGSGGLPRLAYILEGPPKIVLRGRIAVRGVRISAGIEEVPDTPLRAFELRIDGGQSGYLVLSRDVCRREAVADVSFVSQSDERFAQRIPLLADCR